MAWSDEPWVVEGAAVHVSFVAYDCGQETERTLDGRPATTINANLTGGLDLTVVRPLPENAGVAFQGPVKVGPFDIARDVAEAMLLSPNPDGRSNADVVLPWVNGSDLTGRPRGMWIVDFRDMPIEEAALYEAPFEYVKQHVAPLRATNRDAHRRQFWWHHGRSGSEMRSALEGLGRFLVTPRVSKYRVFVWVPPETLPDSAVVAVARDDDYFLGVLQSVVHGLWALRLGTQLETRPRYTPTTTFEPFPFPEPPEVARQEIAEAASVAFRNCIVHSHTVNGLPV